MFAAAALGASGVRTVARGETVAVGILRDGQPMQAYVPRGPLGLMGGGRRPRSGAALIAP